MGEGAPSREEEPAPPSGRRPDVEAAAGAGASNPVELEKLIHGRVRLGIVSALSVEDSLSFNELKERLETSAGNVSAHASRLEEAGYLEITKSFEGRHPRTDYRLTARGREALERYLEHMEALIRRVRE